VSATGFRFAVVGKRTTAGRGYEGTRPAPVSIAVPPGSTVPGHRHRDVEGAAVLAAISHLRDVGWQ
jgi:hypothetical protein